MGNWSSRLVEYITSHRRSGSTDRYAMIEFLGVRRQKAKAKLIRSQPVAKPFAERWPESKLSNLWRSKWLPSVFSHGFSDSCLIKHPDDAVNASLGVNIIAAAQACRDRHAPEERVRCEPVKANIAFCFDLARSRACWSRKLLILFLSISS